MANGDDSSTADWFASQPEPPQLITSTATGAGASGGGGDPMDRDYIRQQLTQLYQQHGAQPTGRGTGPTDIEYMVDQIVKTGGWQGGNIGYWSDRIPKEMGGGGGGGGGMGGGDMGGFQGAPGWGTGTSAPPAYVPPTFTAPTGLNYQNDPGYVERMKMGTQALQGAAAARGSLLGGGTLKALERYGQDYGSNEYGNVYGRAANTFNMNANLGLQGYQTNVSTQRNAQQDYWNRLRDLYGGGQQATSQTYQKP